MKAKESKPKKRVEHPKELLRIAVLQREIEKTNGIPLLFNLSEFAATVCC